MDAIRGLCSEQLPLACAQTSPVSDIAHCLFSSREIVQITRFLRVREHTRWHNTIRNASWLPSASFSEQQLPKINARSLLHLAIAGRYVHPANQCSDSEHTRRFGRREDIVIGRRAREVIVRTVSRLRYCASTTVPAFSDSSSITTTPYNLSVPRTPSAASCFDYCNSLPLASFCAAQH